MFYSIGNKIINSDHIIIAKFHPKTEESDAILWLCISAIWDNSSTEEHFKGKAAEQFWVELNRSAYIIPVEKGHNHENLSR